MLDTQNALFVLRAILSKDSNSNLIVFNNWGRINDNHVGHVYISDNNTGIDLYCCHTTPCSDSANHTRLNIIP